MKRRLIFSVFLAFIAFLGMAMLPVGDLHPQSVTPTGLPVPPSAPTLTQAPAHVVRAAAPTQAPTAAPTLTQAPTEAPVLILRPTMVDEPFGPFFEGHVTPIPPIPTATIEAPTLPAYP